MRVLWVTPLIGFVVIVLLELFIRYLLLTCCKNRSNATTTTSITVESPINSDIEEVEGGEQSEFELKVVVINNNHLGSVSEIAKSCSDCTICMDNLDGEGVNVLNDDTSNSSKKVILLQCGHRFHAECMGLWLMEIRKNNKSDTCPTCRRDIPIIYLELPIPKNNIIEEQEDLNFTDDIV